MSTDQQKKAELKKRQIQRCIETDRWINTGKTDTNTVDGDR